MTDIGRGVVEFGKGFGQSAQDWSKINADYQNLEMRKQILKEAQATKKADLFFKRLKFATEQLEGINKKNKYGAFEVPQKLREARGKWILNKLGIDITGKTNPEGKMLLDTLIDKDPPTAEKALAILKQFGVSERVRKVILKDPQAIRNIVRSPMSAIQDYITQRAEYNKKIAETGLAKDRGKKVRQETKGLVSEEKRKVELQPSALKKAEAEAATAGFEQAIKEAEAEDIGKKIKADRAETEAKTEKALAEAAETKAKTKKLNMLLKVFKDMEDPPEEAAPTRVRPTAITETPARSSDEGPPLSLTEQEVERDTKLARKLAILEPGAGRALASATARRQATPHYKKLVKIAEAVGKARGELRSPVKGSMIKFLGLDPKQLGNETPLTLAAKGYTIPNPDAVKRLKQKQVAATTMISRGNRILKMVDGRPELLGMPGGVSRAIVGMTSSLQGFARLVPGSEDAYNRIPQSAKNVVEGVISNLTEPGLKSTTVQSQLTDFVYRVGALADQTGKGFSDKDYENFAKVAAYGMSSPDAMKAVIRTLAITTQELYNIDFKNETGKTKSLGVPDRAFKDLSMEALQNGVFEKLLSDDQLQEYQAEVQNRISAIEGLSTMSPNLEVQ